MEAKTESQPGAEQQIVQQTALVTGGNRGIGIEIVKSILSDGDNYFVFMGCRDLDEGEKVAKTLCETFGPRVEAVRLDVADAESIKEAARVVSARVPHLSALINNAGIMLDADDAPFSISAVREMMQVNFTGVIAVTSAFLPMLARAPEGGQILSTSSGVGTRTMALLADEHRQSLMSPALKLEMLQAILEQLVHGLQNPDSPYRSIPTVGYGLSKLGVNCFTQIMAREHPSMRINACSPGFCNTGMCANYVGLRKPKDPALGASVFSKVMFGSLGAGRTGAFFKEASKADTPLEKALSLLEPWVAVNEK